MITSKVYRIRKDFQPLTSTVNLVVRSTASPQTQVYDGEVFEPDRGVTPLVIIPQVIAKSTDGSWDEPYANKLLAPTSIKWLVNGVDVTTLSDWKSLVTIDSTSDSYSRGMISISRNVLPSESFDLQFKGTFTDTRLGVNIDVQSEIVSLNTVSKADDAYGLSLGNTTNFKYNIFQDRLFANDLYQQFGVGTEKERTDCYDGKQYLFSMPIVVCHGTKQTTEGFSIKLFRITDGKHEELSANGLEVNKIGTDEIIIDCRFVTKEEYLVELLVDDVHMDAQQFSISREDEGYNCSPIFAMSIQPSDEYHRNKLRVETDNQVISNPGYYLNINWYATSANVQKQAWQSGERCVINLTTAGVGNTSTDGWLQVWAETEPKGAFEVMDDETGEAFTDENGEIFINN